MYSIACKKCKEGGVLAEYWGETARTAFERGEEHLEGMRNQDESNGLWKHSQIHHGGKLRREELEMKVVETHRSPLSRQIHEGVEIETNSAEIVMNSKAEWNQSRLPKIILNQETDRQKTRRVV